LKRQKALALAVMASFAVVGCTRAQDDPAFGAKVKAYLMAHPEVIAEAVQKLQDQRDAASAAKAKLALQHDRQALERDPRDFVANPGGKITVTEFYDYRCPHCINAAPAVMKIIKDNPDVRFVFKEMPIFGAVSEHAARTAIAVKAAGGDYLGLYQTMMGTRGLDDTAIDKAARAGGVDPDKAKHGPSRTAADAQLADTRKLANDLDIEGTPTFVIGDTMVPGEDMDSVRAAIAKAREGAKAS
jgi:protein-disulfide isomerase